MPKIEKHPAGSFCWVELATRDQAAAKRFYSAIFGWVPVDNPMGPDAYYTMFKLDGADAAAAYGMNAEELAMAPPHWNLYVAVDSADATGAKGTELGGRALARYE